MTANDILSFIVCSLFIIASIYLAIKKELIKDSWSPSLQQLHPSWTKPYSLSRSQLLWWTLVIVVCCFAGFVKTGKINFNTTALTLFGFALTTVTGGGMIDKDQSQAALNHRHQDKPSEGFWTDILSDENGMSVGRFQTVVLNILFGLVFLSTFFKFFQFPDFGSWQLALLGASSSGYLINKLNENSSATVGGHNSGSSAQHDMTA
jgi:hypothetical protein